MVSKEGIKNYAFSLFFLMAGGKLIDRESASPAGGDGGN